MHHFFMLVVILALLPAAVATAIALAEVLIYLFFIALIIGGVIFLLLNPEALLAVVVVLAGFLGLMAAGYGVMWLVARVERRWPGLMRRVGFGSVALLCGCLALWLPLQGMMRGASFSDVAGMFLFFVVATAIFLWWLRKSQSLDVSQ
jgi:hypothetical protein